MIRTKDTTGMILITQKLSEALKKVLLPPKIFPESLTQIKTLLKKYSSLLNINLINFKHSYQIFGHFINHWSPSCSMLKISHFYKKNKSKSMLKKCVQMGFRFWMRFYWKWIWRDWTVELKCQKCYKIFQLCIWHYSWQRRRK